MGKKENYLEIIKKMPYIHCARGSIGCSKCKEFEEKGESYALVKIYVEPGIYTRPLTTYKIAGKELMFEYDVDLRFDGEQEAREYAKNNCIDFCE